MAVEEKPIKDTVEEPVVEKEIVSETAEKIETPVIEAPKKEAAPKTVEKKTAPVSAKPKKAEEKKKVPAKAEKKEVPKQPKIDPWTVLKFPHLSEKSTANIELQNKLVFIVKNRASRKQIKDAVESAFNVKVVKVNMTSTTKGEKKAFVRLDAKNSAADIATRLGMM